MTRPSKLSFNWSRIPRSRRESSTNKTLYACDEISHRGGGYESFVDHSPTAVRIAGRSGPVGSRLSTPPAVRQSRPAASRRQAHSRSRKGGVK